MHRLFTDWLTGKKREKRPDLTPEPEPESVQKRVQRLEITVGELEERLVALRSHHNKLRGRVYGDLTDNSTRSAVEKIPVGDKVALRAAAGLTIGRPFTHQE